MNNVMQRAPNMIQQLSQVAGRLPARIYGIIAIAFLIIVSLYTWRPSSSYGTTGSAEFDNISWQQPQGSAVRDIAANATLGFQKLLALSVEPSWRTRGLQAAASLVGLEFTIPPQPKNPDALVNAFIHIGDAEGKRAPALGSAKAWFAHLDMLKFVIASDLETAFIVEDDVDFDLRLKDQMRLVSDNVRNFTKTPAHDPTPFGSSWDVLWLGHCGSRIETGQDKQEAKYRDDTAIPPRLYAGWNGNNLEHYVAESQRLVHTSMSATVCTFGYGITRSAAQKVLTISGTSGDEAYDVNLANLCRTNVIRCIMVSPQLMQHYVPPLDQGYVSEVDVNDDNKQAADESKYESKMGSTGNIQKSARCKALFNSECLAGPWRVDQPW